MHSTCTGSSGRNSLSVAGVRGPFLRRRAGRLRVVQILAFAGDAVGLQHGDDESKIGGACIPRRHPMYRSVRGIDPCLQSEVPLEDRRQAETLLQRRDRQDAGGSAIRGRSLRRAPHGRNADRPWKRSDLSEDTGPGLGMRRPPRRFPRPMGGATRAMPRTHPAWQSRSEPSSTIGPHRPDAAEPRPL